MREVSFHIWTWAGVWILGKKCFLPWKCHHLRNLYVCSKQVAKKSTEWGLIQPNVANHKAQIKTLLFPTQSPKRTEGAGPTCRAARMTLSLQFAQRADHQTKKNYSLSLRFNRIFLVSFWYTSPISSFQFLPLEMGMSSWPTIPVPLLYLESHNSSGFPGEEFCLRMNHSSSISHIWLFRWYLDETSDVTVILEWIKNFGQLGWNQCILHKKKGMDFGEPKVNVMD